MTHPRTARATLATITLLLPATVLAAPASAATNIKGTVVGAPTSSRGLASVPVLLSVTSGRSLRTNAAVVRVRVPAARGIRARTGVLAPGGLRIGDRVHARVGRLTSGSVRTSVLRISARGGAASFDRLKRSRLRAADQAAAAATAVGQLDATGSGVEGATADDASELRRQLMDLRYDLNVLIADMRILSEQITDAIARIERGRPADPSRRSAVARRQAPLIAELARTRDDLDRSRTDLEDAVTRLDRAILDVGGVSAPSLPIGTVGTVTDTVQLVLALLGKPQGANGR